MRQRGFSLTELVLVIIVTGILAVVVVPAFNNSGAFSARGYSDEVLSAARYAQKMAVASGCPVQLRLAGADGYSLWRMSACTTPGYDTRIYLPGRGAGDTATPPSGSTLASVDIDFLANGSSSGGNFAITYDGEVRNFNVHAATGYVEKL